MPLAHRQTPHAKASTPSPSRGNNSNQYKVTKNTKQRTLSTDDDQKLNKALEEMLQLGKQGASKQAGALIEPQVPRIRTDMLRINPNQCIDLARDSAKGESKRNTLQVPDARENEHGPFRDHEYVRRASGYGEVKQYVTAETRFHGCSNGSLTHK